MVKADVLTYEPKATSSDNEQGSVDPHPSNPALSEDDLSKVKDIGNTDESATEQDESSFEESPSPQHPETNHKNLDSTERGKSSGIFKGKITCNVGIMFRNRPQKEAKTGSKAHYNEALNFEGWVIGEPWKDGLYSEKKDNRWYKVAGQDWWLPAFHIEGEPPSDMPPIEGAGGNHEEQ